MKRIGIIYDETYIEDDKLKGTRQIWHEADHWPDLESAVNEMKILIGHDARTSEDRFKDESVLMVFNGGPEAILIVDEDLFEARAGESIQDAFSVSRPDHRPLVYTPEMLKAEIGREAGIFTIPAGVVADLQILMQRDEILKFLSKLSNEFQKPIVADEIILADDGGLSPAFIIPKGWSFERARGWLATTEPGAIAQYGLADLKNPILKRD